MATAIQIGTDRSSRRAARRDSSPSLPALAPQRMAMLSAILDRPMPSCVRQGDCECGECRTIRARSITCDRCGYTGQPYVNPCICVSTYHSWTKTWRQAVRQAKRHGKDRTFGYSAENCAANLAAHLATPCPTECVPSAPTGSCLHGYVECPVCVPDMDNPAYEDDRQHPWTIIRDLRSVLAGWTDEVVVCKSRTIDAYLNRDSEGYTELLIEASDVVRNADRPNERWLALAVKSPEDAAALGYALLRAAQLPVREMRS